MTPVMRRTLIAVAADMLDSKASHRSVARRALVSYSGWLPLVCQVTTHSIVTVVSRLVIGFIRSNRDFDAGAWTPDAGEVVEVVDY